ncbi:MAG TPA: ABC transporter substrate-binding protein [Bacteroidales bacterium]|nr:ABC transporter substrate-binding protein [Bacteroidales bacterium]
MKHINIRHRKKLYHAGMYLAFLQLLFIMFITGCTQKENEQVNRTVFRYNESKGIATLDPAYARSQTIIWPVNQLYNGLVQLSDSLTIEPCIARSWEISDSGKLYTFHLRQDVYFHPDSLFGPSGTRTVNAHDVLFSLNRISDPGTASPGAWIFHDLKRDAENNQTGMRAINDSTLLIFLKKSFPGFLGILTMQYCDVVAPEVVRYYGKDYRTHPIGTGPFKLKLWKEGEKLVMVKNLHYFEKDSSGKQLPFLDAVAITFIADKQSEFLEFMKGNIDFLSGVNPAYKDELITRSGQFNQQHADRFKMITEPYLNTEYLGILVDTSLSIAKNSPLKSRAVRQALNYGFDRKKMMMYLRNNLGTPANAGFIPKGLPSYDPQKVKGYYFDHDKARSLLKEAGYGPENEIPPVTLTTTSDYLDLCEYIQHEVAGLGIEINIEVATGATFREMVANSKVNFFRGSWIADYPDAENYLALFYSKNFSPSGPNYTHFSNNSYDSLYNKALQETDRIKRIQLYRKMDELIIREAPVIPLYYDVVVRFTRKEVTGLGSNPLNLLSLKKVRIAND